jgi:hypothetical protein
VGQRTEQDDRATPKHPERICWGCDNYCRAGDLMCGSRTRHPVEVGEGDVETPSPVKPE